MGTSEQANIVHDSWDLTHKLIRLGEEKMWEVIRGVWVAMLFSAGRCRVTYMPRASAPVGSTSPLSPS
jgi:hypothetical protein